MPSPIHRLVRTLAESKVLGKLLDRLPTEVRDALEYVVSDAKPSLIQRGPLSEGDAAQGVAVFLGQVRRGASLRGVNLMKGTITGGTVRGCNVGAVDVLDGDVRGMNLLVGDVHGGRLDTNILVGNVLGGEATRKIHVGEVIGGSVNAEKQTMEVLAAEEGSSGGTEGDSSGSPGGNA